MISIKLLARIVVNDKKIELIPTLFSFLCSSSSATLDTRDEAQRCDICISFARYQLQRCFKYLGSSSWWSLANLASLSSSSARAVFVTEPSRSSLITCGVSAVIKLFKDYDIYHLDVLPLVVEPVPLPPPLLLLLLLLVILLALPPHLILPPGYRS